MEILRKILNLFSLEIIFGSGKSRKKASDIFKLKSFINFINGCIKITFYVYILKIKAQNKSPKYYVMTTNNLTKRLKNIFYCIKKVNCIDYISLKYCESFKDRKEAIKQKKAIRTLPTNRKKELIQKKTIDIDELEHVFGLEFSN